MIKICRRDVPTMIVIGKDATIPARLAFKVIANGVWKYNHATNSAMIHPANPATSAADRRQTSRTKITRTGRRARMIDSVFKDVSYAGLAYPDAL